MSADRLREADVVECDCSLGWRYRKGNGPDPAQCPVHGERRNPPTSPGGAK